jgi:F0F1-type ATP synthase assembly protein I
LEIKEDNNKESVSLGRALTLVYQIGFTIVFSILFFLFIGKKLDEWLGTSVLFTVVGVVFGVVGGGYVVYKEIEKI